MKNKKDNFAYPGKYLGSAYDYSIGDSGVYRKEDKIFSSLTGNIIIDNTINPPKISIKNDLTEYIPTIGDEVYIRINKVTKTGATGDILVLKNKVLKEPIISMLKSENVRNDFRDFDIFECFYPCDIIFAKIISIDQTNFVYVSTADIQYGVIFARSQLTKNLMMPTNFEKMLCLETKLEETRKVAKPNFI